MLSRLKSALIGTPLPTQQLAEKRLNKIRALAAFSPDALSSITYSNQEIFLGLVVAGSAGLVLAWPIGLAIIGVLIIVAISYYQTVHGYPSGGGSYIVARANLGIFPGLIAAGALLLDYLDLTDQEHNDGTQAAVVLPEFIPARRWHTLLHNQSSMLIKAALLYRRRTPGYQRIVIDVPYRLKK